MKSGAWSGYLPDAELMTDDSARRKEVTLADVAREAGVSRATASLVLRKSPLVGSKTRKKVEAAIETLGYVYNLGAARMRAGRSRTVGVIVPNLTNPFFAELLTGIEATLDTADHMVIVANSRDSAENQANIIRRMREHGVDGLIVCPAFGSRPSLVSDAQAWALPLVQALRFVSSSGGDYAGADYAGGMRQAVDHLVALGHRSIAFITGNRRHSAAEERLDGFRSAMTDHGLSGKLVFTIPLTPADAMETAAKVLAAPERPSAAICFNDVVALGLSSGLSDLGVQPGRDFSVIGFDNVRETEIARPKLTSIATYPLEIGATAAKLLLDRLAAPSRPATRIVHLTTLIERQSCSEAKTPPK